MKTIARLRGASLKSIRKVSAYRVNDILTKPTKRDLREDLAEAVRNTAKLPTPTEGETDATDH